MPFDSSPRKSDLDRLIDWLRLQDPQGTYGPRAEECVMGQWLGYTDNACAYTLPSGEVISSDLPEPWRGIADVYGGRSRSSVSHCSLQGGTFGAALERALKVKEASKVAVE